MNKQVKEQWLDALRSGDYKQGTGKMKIGDEYCCLGVLTDLYIQEHGCEWGPDGSFHGECAEPPGKVVKWAGLPKADPRVDDSYANKLSLAGHKYLSLAWLNDNGATFEQIADVIEDWL